MYSSLDISLTELLSKLLTRAVWLPDIGTINKFWPKSCSDLLSQTMRAIALCQDPNELRRAQEMVDKRHGNTFWHRLPKELGQLLAVAILDNPHSLFFEPARRDRDLNSLKQ